MSEKKVTKKQNRLRLVIRLAVLLILLGLLAWGGLMGYVYYMETHVEAPSDYDSIIVLGAQVLPTGEPSVQLRWRLDKAIEMYELSPCPIVVCGGQGGNEPEPEGAVMRRVLLADGLPEAHVYADVVSEDTKENLQNAMAILTPLGCEKPLIVTTDYHLPRALSIAEDYGLNAQGAGSLARNELGFWLKNHMREALSWVKYWGIKYLGLPL